MTAGGVRDNKPASGSGEYINFLGVRNRTKGKTRFLKKNLNASRPPSEHPSVRGKKMPKRLVGHILFYF